ncbi:NFACT family protein [Candidatus Woesearchaeota archaeon]|nr:NFACT family protein [Candidatus Woesearchaeota archaeon]
MKTQLSALDLHYLIKELKFLINSRIDKIYHPSKKELILQLFVSGKGKQQLLINAGNYLYLTSFKSPSQEPSDFCMYLRKKLTNSRLIEINQLDFERIIEFKFQTKQETFSLIFEMFSKGNILLLKQNKILSAVEYQKYSTRTIKPKENYIYPKKEFNFLELTQTDIKKLIATTTKESIVKSLAIDLGLGGVYSEEICLLSKINKNSKPSELNDKEISALFTSLKEIKNKKPESLIIYENNLIKDITPFKLSLYKTQKQKAFENLSSALEEFFSQSIPLEQLKYQKQINKTKEIIEKQIQHLEELKQQEQLNKEKAELLYKNYKLVKEILEELKQISKKHDWKEIKEKLKGHKLIKEVIPKEKSVILELK